MPFFLFFLFLITPIFSSAEELISEDDVFAEIPITSATRLAQSQRNLPVSLTLIDHGMIEKMGATELADIFRMVPGFKVGRLSGGMYSVVGHDIGDQFSRRLLVLVNGRSVQSAFIELMDWNAIPIEIDDIDYIEVMRGSSSAVYGSNAFIGAINIVTYKPFEVQGLQARQIVGSQNVASTFLKYGFNAVNADHSLSVSHKKGSGLDNRHDGHEFTKLRYHGSYIPSFNDEFELELGVSSGFLQEDNLIAQTILERPRDTGIDEQFFSWKHRYDNGEELLLKLYRNHIHYADSIFEPETKILTKQPFIFHSKSQRYGMDLQRNFNFEHLRLVVGTSIYQDDIESLTQRDGTNRHQQLYTTVEWNPLDKLFINTSLMLEDTKYSSPSLSPRISFNYLVNNKHSFRLSAARSYRVTAQRAFKTSTSKDVPEKNTSFEIAHQYSDNNMHIKLDSKLFYEIFQDIPLVWRNSSNKNVISSGRYNIKGFETQLSFTPTTNTLLSLQYNFSQSLNKSPYEIFDHIVPSHIASALASYEFDNQWQMSMTYSFVDTMPWKSWGNTIPAYNRLDLRVAKNFKVSGKELKFALIGQNLTGKHYDFNFQNVVDKRFFLQVSLSDR